MCATNIFPVFCDLAYLSIYLELSLFLSSHPLVLKEAEEILNEGRMQMEKRKIKEE